MYVGVIKTNENILTEIEALLLMKKMFSEDIVTIVGGKTITLYWMDVAVALSTNLHKGYLTCDTAFFTIDIKGKRVYYVSKEEKYLRRIMYSFMMNRARQTRLEKINEKFRLEREEISHILKQL